MMVEVVVRVGAVCDEGFTGVADTGGAGTSIGESPRRSGRETRHGVGVARKGSRPRDARGVSYSDSHPLTALSRYVTSGNAQFPRVRCITVAKLLR